MFRTHLFAHSRFPHFSTCCVASKVEFLKADEVGGIETAAAAPFEAPTLTEFLFVLK